MKSAVIFQKILNLMSSFFVRIQNLISPHIAGISVFFELVLFES